MSVNLPKAIILAAFANDPEKHLAYLNEEKDNLERVLGVENDDFELIAISNATSENLWECFSEFGKRIVAFHFAGHADGVAEKIILKDQAGNNRGTLMEALADAEGLLPMLQLVFLNGCATRSGVKHFEKNKKLVIATRAPIYDTIAKTFSTYFWTWLSHNPTDSIVAAFDYAKSMIKNMDSMAFRKRFRDKTGELYNDQSLLNQWDLYGRENYVGSYQLFRGAYLAAQLRFGSKKLYEQNPLEKRLQQKGEELNPTFFDLWVVEQNTDHKASLIEGLKIIYNRPIRHSMLLSAGGGGKTISLINVWKYYLQEGVYPIPIYIRLNDINDCSHDAQQDFISWYIATKYLGLPELTIETAAYLKEWLSSDWEKPYPKLLLLLDGFNEITAGRLVEEKLLTDLKNRWRGEKREEAVGIQIVVSSRYESDQAWTHGFARMEIQPIDQVSVQNHLGLKYPTEGDLQRLIMNPLMLALYSASRTTWEQYKEYRYFKFKNQISNVSELMWNYLETQVVKQFVLYENKESEYQAAHFFLKHLFPYLGFQMEKEGVFRLSTIQLEEVIGRAKEQFLNPMFMNVFPRYKIGIKEIDLEPQQSFVAETERMEVWMDRLISRFHFLEVGTRDQKGNPTSYSFTHQNFRDFFSTLHLRNLMEIGIHHNKRLPEIHNRAWPSYLRQMIGELEINQYHKPIWNPEHKSWERSETSPVNILLINYLDLYKNELDNTNIDYGIWNTIETWKQLGLDLSGMDLSNLNLAGVNLNNLVLTKKGVQNTLSANFNGSLLDFNSFMANGHYGRVVCVIHHPILPDIISSDSLGVIKVWSMDTMNCNLTIKAHTSSANKIVFNEAGASIISCSENGNIREWDNTTGKLIKTFEKEHEKSISDIRIKHNGEFLVSASLDNHLKTWNIETGQCVKTWSGHQHGVTSVSIHPTENRMVSGSMKGEIFHWVDDEFSLLFKIDDTAIRTVKYNKTGDNVLVGTASGIAVEYSIAENKIRNSYPKHIGDIFDLLYDWDETSFFTASWEYPASRYYKGTVRQWSLMDGSLMMTLAGHSGRVLSLSLVPHSNNLLSCGYDRNIYEWSVDTGRKINEFHGTSFFIWDMILHPLKENILLFGGTDHVIREWDLELNVCTRNYVGHGGSVSQLLLSSDGKKMYSGSYDGTVRVWCTESGDCIHVINAGYCVSKIAISPDEKSILMGEYSEVSGKIKEVDIESGKLLNVYHYHQATITLLTYLSNGKQFVSYSQSSSDRLLLIWERAKENPINGRRISASDYLIHSLSPDGKKLFLIDKDGAVYECLFDFDLLATGNNNWDLLFKPFKRYEGHEDVVHNLCYYPAYNRLLTSSLDDSIKEWSTVSEDCLNTYKVDNRDYINKEGSNARALYYGERNNIVGIFSGEIIHIWNNGVREAIQAIRIKPGIAIDGLDLTHVKWKNELSEPQRRELEMYGAILNYSTKTPLQSYLTRKPLAAF